MRRFAGRAIVALSIVVSLAAQTTGSHSAQAAGFVKPPNNNGGNLSPADIQRLAQNATDHVIVILRNQHPEVSATSPIRANALASDQSVVLNQLSQVGAANVHAFHLINAVSATVSQAEAANLGANPLVSEVVPDAVIQGPRVVPSDALDKTSSSSGAAHPAGPLPPTPACSRRVTLEPEALQRIRAASQNPGMPQAQQLATGKGVKVAYIADGVDTKNPDFLRADGTSVFADYQDFSGDGPGAVTPGGEAFLDASSIAAQGHQVYDINSTAIFPAAHPCNIRILGVAPDASLYGFDVFAVNHTTTTSNFVQAIEYAVTIDKVDVLNESFGSNPFPDTSLDAVRLADDAAVAAGVTVTVSSGDSSFANTIGSPSSDPNVIAVGASTQFRSYQQTSSAAYQLSRSGYLSDNISSVSSGGFTQQGPRTIDVAAPGDSDYALCTPNTALYTDCTGFNGQPAPYELTGGTSEAAPLTAGTVALVIQAYRRTHHGASPTPALIKSILMSTARDLGYPTDEQGSGLVDAYRAVQAALSYQDSNGSPRAEGNSLVVDNTSFSATDQPNTPENYSFAVTNVGQRSRIVTPQLRTLSRTLQSQTFSINYQPLTTPQFYDEFGTLRTYTEQDFSVVRGVQYLGVSFAWNIAQKPGTLVRLTLFDPRGRFAAYSLPQGLDGFGHVDVATPRAGQWRAILWSPASASAYAGLVQLKVDQKAFSLSGPDSGAFSPPSARILPGQSASFTLHVATPAQPGDQSYAVALNTGSGEYDAFGGLTDNGDSNGNNQDLGNQNNQNSLGSDNGNDQGHVPAVQTSAFGVLPVSLRAEVPISTAGASFTGTLVGGNGRSASLGSGLNYNFEIPAGQTEMSLNFQTPDPNNFIFGYLIDPTGQVQDVQSNITGVNPDGSFIYSSTMQFFRQSPLPGRWLFAIAVGNISGVQVEQPFTANILFNQTLATAPGLPNSSNTILKAGVPVSVPVSVTNLGIAGESFFADPRLSASGDIFLGVTSVQVPLVGGVPQFFVPTQVSSVSFVAASPTPFSFDVSPFYGDPDVYTASCAQAPYTSTCPTDPAFGGLFVVGVQLTAPEITPGLWSLFPSQLGPYPVGGPTPSQVEFLGNAYGLQFDPAVTSDTGDLWNPSIPSYTPLSLQPNQSGTINLTFTPSGAPGTVVTGTLYVDTFNPGTAFGDEVVGLPYSYTIGS